MTPHELSMKSVDEAASHRTSVAILATSYSSAHYLFQIVSKRAHELGVVYEEWPTHYALIFKNGSSVQVTHHSLDHLRGRHIDTRVFTSGPTSQADGDGA